MSSEKVWICAFAKGTSEHELQRNFIRISYSNAGPVNKVQYIQLNPFECFLLGGKLFLSKGCMEGLAAEKKPQFLIEYTET